jgi:hypothetical protein
MARALKRICVALALALPLAGCNSEFSLNCATPKGNYLLMVKPGMPWFPLLRPSLKWVATADVHDLDVLRSDDYQVVGELRNRINGRPAETQRQRFVVNRITSEFQTSYLRSAKDGESGDVEIEAIKGTCSRTFPQRL